MPDHKLHSIRKAPLEVLKIYNYIYPIMSWLDPTLQMKVEYRPGDTIISVPPKSGTTWCMNIFHQLRTGGDADFEDLYTLVPWVEFKEYPGQCEDELLHRWKEMPTDIPRGFKTHSQPGDPSFGNFVPYREDLKYIVVMRNPEEAIVSFQPFLKAHSKEFLELFHIDYETQWDFKETFHEFFHEIVLKGLPGIPKERMPHTGGLLTMWYFNFINNWWPLRDKPNVLMLHFSDMKKDHEGSVRKIADFLGFDKNVTSEEQWKQVFEYTGFQWMKEHQTKFEAPTLCSVPVLNPGAMVRKGKTGSAFEDGMTPEISKMISDFAEQCVPDEGARKWMFEGGDIIATTL